VAATLKQFSGNLVAKLATLCIAIMPYIECLALLATKHRNGDLEHILQARFPKAIYMKKSKIIRVNRFDLYGQSQYY